MSEIEAYAAVRDFVETGGDVLLVIGVVTFWMWILILERYWFFFWVHPGSADQVQLEWDAREDHKSWGAHKIRLLLLTDVDIELQRGLQIIVSLVALCPMLGLLGTVTGMIEVFDVMASSGSGNVRGMAGGISKATLPTMAGMMAALSGLVFSVQLERRAKKEGRLMSDRLITTHV
ncbi:MAG: MotA/TolQ/ExbB proton channel family protein [Myxococcales bacterium]|nr:MotA/TolQ/ExbB proton channel family protein [Myxococcales bacterium]